MLLDMSAAFDTIDHGIIPDVFQRRFGVGDAALDWFASYFAVRTQQVVTGKDSSSVSQLLIGTPQGSVRTALSPTLKMSQRLSSSTAFHIICLLMICRALGAANHAESMK